MKEKLINRNKTNKYNTNVVMAHHVSSQEISNRSNQNAITLIALVITIILLLILAGVTINVILGENGLFRIAQQSSEEYKISQILEKLLLNKIDLFAIKEGNIITVKEYTDYLIEKGILKEENIEELDEKTSKIIVDGYAFLVEEEKNDIKITYIEKVDPNNKSPIINVIKVTQITGNSISIKILASRVDGGMYKYSIKNITAKEEEYKQIATSDKNEFTFTDLPTENEFMIKVELENANGKDYKETAETIVTLVIKVSKIILSDESLELQKGSKQILEVKIEPDDATNKNVTWSTDNQDVVTVTEAGEIKAVGQGMATIKASATDESGISAECKITVTPPPPPSVGTTGATHSPIALPYSWSELEQVAKVISDNTSKVNNDTAEVTVSVEGETYKVGVGDTVKLNGKQVRILGFNHDKLANKSVYGGNNTYAGISFEYVDFITSNSNIDRAASKTWQASTIRSTLNGTLYNGIKNYAKIKQITKICIEGYLSSGYSTNVNDYLWLLSEAEVFGSAHGDFKIMEGTRYKFYKNGNIGYKPSLGGRQRWWLRTPYPRNTYQYGSYTSVGTDGKRSLYSQDNLAGIAPGFAI